MELSYFRKSTRSFSDTVEHARTATTDAGFSILAEKDLVANEMYLIVACKAEWAKELIATDHRLAGFLPCGIIILRKGADVFVGTGQPSIIKSLVHSGPLAELAINADRASKELINAAAGVSALKPESVLVYATTTCPYCTKVKNWLTDHHVEHSVVLVDQDQEAGRAMVQKTGQMGVPVTEISYGSDAEPEFIIGFDEARLTEILQFAR